MAKRDYYEILGVDRNADPEQIKRAFRNRARHLHPDNKESGDESAFKELAAAYEVLSDDNKRSLYDRYGHDGLAGGAGGFEGVDLGAFSDLSEIFSQFFGSGQTGRGGFRRGGADRGADLKYDLDIEFLRAVFGGDEKVSVKHLEGCTACDGSGAAQGSQPVQCGTCQGMGQIRQTTQTFLGHFTQVITCPNCEGEGTRIEKPCGNCKGRGQVRKTADLEIKVPPGIDSGTRMRVPGAGDQGRKGGPPGDLYVIVHVREHDVFTREGTHIHIRQPLSFAMAALGCEISVPTLEGPKVLKIQPGTQTGATMVMRGEGVPHLNNPSRRGDELVHLVVETPTKLTQEERKLFEKLAELRGDELTARKPADKDREEVRAADKEKTGGGDANGGSDKDRAGKAQGKRDRKKNAGGKEGQSIIDKIAEAFKTKPDDES